MTLDIALLRQSFQLVLDRNPNLTDRFYAILFSRYPEVEPLFSTRAKAHQPQKLAAALSAAVAHLDDPAWLGRTLGEMGRRHVGYGVTREMYAPVGDALLSAMREAAGDDWNERLESQWSAAYGVIVDLMCPAAPAAEASPVYLSS
jgi:hemoglobin-like flavoprotein